MLAGGPLLRKAETDGCVSSGRVLYMWCLGFFICKMGVNNRLLQGSVNTVSRDRKKMYSVKVTD